MPTDSAPWLPTERNGGAARTLHKKTRRRRAGSNPAPGAPDGPPRIFELSPYGLTEVSGVASVVLSLSLGFTKRGFPTTIIAPGPVLRSLPPSIRTVALSAKGPFRNLFLGVRAACMLWETRDEWELVHGHQGHLVTLAGGLVARILGRPVITTLHLVPPSPGGLRGLVQHWSIALVMRTSTQCIYVSEHTRREFKGAGIVILNGVDAATMGTVPSSRDDLRRDLGLEGCVVMYAGRMARIKGYLDLLAAIRKARDAGSEVRLLATGHTPEGEKDDAKRFVNQLGLGPFVLDLGDREDHTRYLMAADVFALPSYREGLPIALLEAMAAGLPSVVSDAGGIPELVQDGQQGFLVRAGDIDALASSILRLAKSPELRRHLGSNAAAKARTLNIDRTTDAYLSVFIAALRGDPN